MTFIIEEKYDLGVVSKTRNGQQINDIMRELTCNGPFFFYFFCLKHSLFNHFTFHIPPEWKKTLLRGFLERN